MTKEEQKIVEILYTNYRGETTLRKIIPQQISFMSSQWHPEPQWCLEAFDLEKQALRYFTCRDIKSWQTNNHPS
jgi:predicted DNA-binding transcriptional regulator YafY